jgi:hypothetical protein
VHRSFIVFYLSYKICDNRLIGRHIERADNAVRLIDDAFVLICGHAK